MSENSIDFHFTVRLGTKEEKSWVLQLITDPEDRAASVDDGRLVGDHKQFLETVGVKDLDSNNYVFWPNFESEIGDRGIWRIYSDGSGNPDYAAEAVKAYLNKFCKLGFVVFEVAYTNTGGGPDAYGGAGYSVTADGIEIMGTGDWIRDQVNEFAKDGGTHKNGSD